MQPVEDSRDALVEQMRVGAELRGEAVGGVDGRALPADGLAERVVLADQGDRAGPRRDRVEGLGERDADHRPERVAGAARPTGVLKLSDEPLDLRRVEDSCERARRAR